MAELLRKTEIQIREEVFNEHPKADAGSLILLELIVRVIGIMGRSEGLGIPKMDNEVEIKTVSPEAVDFFKARYPSLLF